MTHDALDRHEDHIIIPLRKKILYGMGGFADSLALEAVNSWVMLYYNTILKVESVRVGWALFIPRIWDAISDPLMGHISDNFRSRWGRRRPFILVGGPLFCLFFFFMWCAPDAWSETGKFAYLLVMSLLFYTMYTVAMVPYSALGGELSRDYHERTRIYAFRTYWDRAGSVLVGAMWLVAHNRVLFSSSRQGFMVTALGLACLAGLAFLGVAYGAREEAELQQRPKMKLLPAVGHLFTNGPYVLLTVMTVLVIIGIFASYPFGAYVNIYHVFGGNKEAAGPVMMVTRWMTTGLSVVSVIVLSWLATKIGKRNAFLVSLSFLAFAPISSWWVFTPQHPWLQLVFAVLVAPSMGVAVLANAMVADLVDLDELRTDRRREGMYFAFIAFLQKAAFSFSTLWVGYCLRWVGFNENLDLQRPDTIHNLRLLFALMPLAFIVLSFILLMFYPLSEQRVREIRDVLEARRRERLQERATAP